MLEMFLLSLTFFHRIVFMGYKKSLMETDIWSLNPRDVSAKSARKFDNAWAKEIEKSTCIRHR